MIIVITDGYTLNPGDLSWQSFYEMGEVQYYDRTRPDEVAVRIKHAHVVITNKTQISAGAMEMATNLKLIAVTATGYNVVDVAAAKQNGIKVCNVPEYGTDSVAQHTIALLLELTNHVGEHGRSVRAGEWSRSVDWCYSNKPIMELSGKTLGIVGYGRIGQKVASIASALGMKIMVYNKGKQYDVPTAASLEELFKMSDVVSLHCPLKDDSREFVNAKLLTLMKPSSLLINTSRGQLIHEQDLAIALKKNILAGAALDVLQSEPPASDHPLISVENCMITPHNAWISFEARQRLMQTTLENVKTALSGHPQNVVN